MNQSSNIEIIIRTVDQTTKETKTIGKSLQEFGKTLAKIGGIATGVGATINKAMDFGKQGAQAKVLASAFQRLGGDLDALRKASRGTVSDFELMNATNTLLIGTSGGLQKVLVQQAPKLMEIAKAASTLNPALGDTTFLYESLARGIKRSSPLILDNLGLTIKIGDANEKYAKSIGKTVDQLSAEETQLALLQEVLRSGEGLIGTATGIDTSEIDSIERMEASFANLGMTLKEMVAPAMANVASGLELIVTWGTRMEDMQQGQQKVIEKTSKTYDEYIKRTMTAAVATGDLTKEQEERFLAMLDYGKLTTDILQDELQNVDILNDKEFDLNRRRLDNSERYLASKEKETAVIEAQASNAEKQAENEQRLLDIYKEQQSALDVLYSKVSQDWVSAAEDLLNAISFMQGGGEATAKAVGSGEQALGASLGLEDAEEQARLQALIADETERIQVAEVKRQQAMGDIDYWDAYNKLYEVTGSYAEASVLAKDATYDWQKELEDADTTLENITNWINYLLGVDEIRVKAIIDVDTVGSSLPVGPNGLVPLASGGKLENLSLVGEQGPEMIINGTVIPAKLTAALLGLGVTPGKTFASGGPLLDGTYTVDQVAAMYGGASVKKGMADTAYTAKPYTTASNDAVSAVEAVSETTSVQIAALGAVQQANVNRVSLQVASRIEQSNDKLADKMDELIGKVLDEDGAIRSFRTAFRMGG